MATSSDLPSSNAPLRASPLPEEASPLPVPALEETAERYLDWVRPLLADDAYARCQKVVADFVNGEGPLLQQQLQQFAEAQNATGDSWLSAAWLDGYLSVRESLPLSTSGAFRLDLDLPDRGLNRLAYLMVGLAKESADYLQGRLAPHLSPRGETLDMRQWRLLQGIGRIPQSDCDRYEVAPMNPQQRDVIVFWHDQAYALPILDAAHQPYPVSAVVAMLTDIVQTQQPTSPTSPPATPPVMALSLAPAESASDLLAELSQSATNRAHFQLLAHSLFHVHLSPTAFADDATALQALTFLGEQRLWAYKPLTLCANRQNDRYFAHLEHSSYDAGALQAILARSEVTAQTLASQAAAEPNDSRLASTLPTATALHWQVSDAARATLTAIARSHREKAQRYRVSIATIPIDRDAIPPRTSIDCLMQLPMQYAQRQAFGAIRNTYESVDVSHFQAGRTECLRPVSSDAVAFVHALREGRATLSAFKAAHQTHKARIKACKRGHGVNRHLLGLQLMAQQHGVAPALFRDAGYAALTGDFLSTSSLGNRRWVGDFGFTPTMTGGLGISYFLTDDSKGFLYCLSYHEDQADAVTTFINALHDGTQRMMAVLATNTNTSKTNG